MLGRDRRGVILAAAVRRAAVFAGLAAGMTAGHTELLAQLHELLELFAGQLARLADLAGKQGDLRVVLDLVHHEERLGQRVADRERAVVLQQEGVMILDIGHQRIGNLLGGGAAVDADRHGADRQDRLGQQVLLQRDVADRKRRRRGRMRMNDRIHVGTLAVHAQMHFELGGGVELTLDLVALTVYADDHIGGHVALRYAGRGAVKFVRADLDGDVAVIRGDIPLAVDAGADVTDFFFDLVGRLHVKRSFCFKFCLNLIIFTESAAPKISGQAPPYPTRSCIPHPSG